MNEEDVEIIGKDNAKYLIEEFRKVLKSLEISGMTEKEAFRTFSILFCAVQSTVLVNMIYSFGINKEHRISFIETMKDAISHAIENTLETVDKLNI